MVSRFKFCALAVAALMSVGGVSQAANVDISLTASASAAFASSVPSGSSVFYFTNIEPLTVTSVNGVSNASAYISPGDTVSLDVTFDQPLTVAIPPDANLIEVRLLLQGDGLGTYPNYVNTSTTNGTAQASLGGTSIGGYSQLSCSTAGQLCDPGLGLTPGSVTQLSFDHYNASFTVDPSVASALTVNYPIFEVVYASPVPEPTEYALTIVGLAVLALASRRRPA